MRITLCAKCVKHAESGHLWFAYHPEDTKSMKKLELALSKFPGSKPYVYCETFGKGFRAKPLKRKECYLNTLRGHVRCIPQQLVGFNCIVEVNLRRYQMKGKMGVWLQIIKVYNEIQVRLEDFAEDRVVEDNYVPIKYESKDSSDDFEDDGLDIFEDEKEEDEEDQKSSSDGEVADYII